MSTNVFNHFQNHRSFSQQSPRNATNRLIQSIENVIGGGSRYWLASGWRAIVIPAFESHSVGRISFSSTKKKNVKQKNIILVGNQPSFRLPSIYHRARHTQFQFVHFHIFSFVSENCSSILWRCSQPGCKLCGTINNIKHYCLCRKQIPVQA